MSKKVRLDAELTARGLVESRAKAQAVVLAGEVFVGGERATKAGTMIRPDATLEVRSRSRYASRGGDKLEAALRVFMADGLVVEGRRCLDVGASTGGFTDCLLQHGARSVAAVDVGYGQLAHKLRQDPRVDVRERTNARHMTRHDFGGGFELIVVDASFISLALLLPAIANVSDPGTDFVALIKPQFEVGRDQAAREKGVIRDPVARREAIERTVADATAAGFHARAGIDCPVLGPKGNQEYLLWATFTPDAPDP